MSHLTDSGMKLSNENKREWLSIKPQKWGTRGTKEFSRKLIIRLSASTGFINASSDAESADPQMEKYRKDARRRCAEVKLLRC